MKTAITDRELREMAQNWSAQKRREMSEVFKAWSRQLTASAKQMDRAGELLEVGPAPKWN
jgi:hypothetical protein